MDRVALDFFPEGTSNVRTIGILGGIASGKSLVAEGFEVLGAARLDGDELGHFVLEEPDVRQALLKRWGPRILRSDGHLDRRAISHIVFGSDRTAADELRFLEEVTHPRIERRLADGLEAARAAGTEVAVVDAAVMLKAGWDKYCDLLIFVEVPREERLRRVLARGWSEAQFTVREAAQVPIEVKRRRAHLIVDNSGSLEETFSQVKAVWKSLHDTPCPPCHSSAINSQSL